MEVGTDILYIPRLQKIIQENPAFLKKVYTKKEREIASTMKNPIYFYATRFAGKEAILKATNGMYEFEEIEILKEENGKPSPRLLKEPSLDINLSLSFDNDYVIAFCIIKK